MNILIVIDTLASGGAQKLKVELASGLNLRGHNVEFFIYDDNYNFYEPVLNKLKIKIHVCKRESQGFSWKVVKGLRNIVKSSRFDHVISSLHAPSIYASIALIGIKNTKLTVCEESSSLAKISYLKRYMFYLASLMSDNLVTNSHNEYKLIRKLPGRSKKTKVIWNGFDLSSINFFINHNSQRKGISKLLIVGRVAFPKNGVNLLKALSLFESRNGWVPEINWIGRRDYDLRSLKDKRSKEMIDQMDNYLETHKSLSSNFNWLGSVPDVFAYYKTTDALLSVSLYEGMPMVICEAMLSGCFVIASSVCDHPKVLGNNERGLLCDPSSPKSICLAIEKLNIMQAKEKVNIIQNARKYAEINFDREHMLDEYESLIYSHTNR